MTSFSQYFSGWTLIQNSAPSTVTWFVLSLSVPHRLSKVILHNPSHANTDILISFLSNIQFANSFCIYFVHLYFFCADFLGLMSFCPSSEHNLQWKLRQQSTICWNSLGLFRDYGLNYIYNLWFHGYLQKKIVTWLKTEKICK